MDDELGIQKLEFNQIHEQVYDLLKQEIFRSNLSPGQRLSMDALAEHFGVSVTPVRDALRRLNADGLVDIVPRRGTFVAKFDTKSIRDVFQIRRILETAAAEQLAHQPQCAPSQHLEEIVDEMRALSQGEAFRDHTRYVALDISFHDQIITLFDNEKLAEFWHRLYWTVHLSRGLVLRQMDLKRVQAGVAEHAAIAQAFSKCDVQAAKAAVIKHLENAEADLLTRIANVQ